MKLGAVGNLVEAGQVAPPWARELKPGVAEDKLAELVAPPWARELKRHGDGSRKAKLGRAPVGA